jgi:hypothetical protein
MRIRSVVSVLRSWVANRYKPEKHYMRGPGPARNAPHPPHGSDLRSAHSTRKSGGHTSDPLDETARFSGRREGNFMRGPDH